MTDNSSSARLAERLEHTYFGKYRGTVIDNKDPDQLGRLRLQVPSVLGVSDDAVTDWAWPCVPFTGPAYGVFWIPEEGAHVWVEFEEGLLDVPIWSGGYWARNNGQTTVPEGAKAMQDNKPQRRLLRTASGHQLEFSDVDGEETVTIRHKDGAVITMDARGSVVIANKEGSHIYLNAENAEASFIDQHGNNIAMNDQGLTLTNKDGSVVDMAGPQVQVIAKNVHLRSETVSLGEGAMEPAILGMSFAAVFDAHVHPTALGPSGPPIPVPMPLSAPTHPAVSKVVKLK